MHKRWISSVSNLIKIDSEKISSFMPSNTDIAPSNDWISETGYPGNSEMDAPQNMSDEQTYYSPENDRPRSKNFLKRMLSLFQKPLSKKEPKEIVPVKEAEVKKKSYEGDLYGWWISPLPDERIYSLEDPRQEHYESDIIRGVETPIADGWTRVRLAGNNLGIELFDMTKLPEVTLDNILSDNPVQQIVVDDRLKGHVTISYENAIQNGIQKAVNKALQEKRMQTTTVKEASSNVFYIETDSGLKTKVLRDPTPEQAKNLFNTTRGEVHQLRWFITDDHHLYMWDAYDIIHWDAMKQLGLSSKTFYDEGRNMGIARTEYEAEIDAEQFRKQPVHAKQAKQWTTPKEPVNQPGMDWGWADYIYNYVDENWQDLLHDWLELDPKNYVKPVVLIQEIYKDEGAVSAWVHIEFVNKAGNADAYMKLIITGDIHYEPSYEPEGVETHEWLDNWEIDVKDFGKSDELEKTSGYGPTNYKGPAVADHGYQNSAWDDMNTTYSPEENDENMKQNGKGGYPQRFMGLPKGKYYTDEGKVVKMLEETSALEILPPQQPITENTNAGTAIMMDDGSIYFSNEPHMIHVKLIKQLGLPIEHIQSGGRIVDGVYIDAGNMSDTMRYVEREMAGRRADERRKQYRSLSKKQADLSGETVNHILNLIYKNGGATWNMSKGNLSDQPYFAVAIYPEKEQIVEMADFENLEEYLVSNESLLNNSNNSFGAWVSGNKVYFDIVATIADKNEAIKLGQQHGQLAIFDLKNLVEIPLQRTASLKQAGSVLNVEGVRVYKNPTGNQVYNLFKKSKDQVLRFYVSSTGELYVWDAFDLGHGSVMEAIGDEMTSGNYAGAGAYHDPYQAANHADNFRKQLKQAAAVSDKEQEKYYDEIFSDRWRDDSSKIDGGNNYYDFPEGGQDYPGPEDEHREHCLLDQLQKPIDRLDPRGLGEYSITYYDSMPAGNDDGGI